MRMIFVTGGIASGKLSYIRSMGYEDRDISRDPGSDSRVIYDLEGVIKDLGGNTEGLFDKLKDREVVCCSEIGCGIVPISKEERKIREETGRLCCMLAEKAEKVIRLNCGIAQIIKDIS